MTLEKCPNGHLIFSTPLGRGCLKNGCTFRAPKTDPNEKRKPRDLKLPTKEQND